MKRSYLSIALLLSCAVSSAFAMENTETSGGPMNDKWFYAEKNPFKSANQLYQKQDWKRAVKEYRRLLQSQDLQASEYDRNMAELNCASCCMALQLPSSKWRAYDALSGIPKDKQLPKEMGNVLNGLSVLIKTDQVGIGDIFHFIEVVAEFQERTGAYPVLSVRPFLKWAFEQLGQGEAFEIVSDKAQPETDYVTHIVGLYGHLKLAPGMLEPEHVLFTAPEEAMGKVSDLLKPRLEAGNTIAAIFLGENRQATLIGGKQLPRDSQAYGRHLDPNAVKALLKKHPKLLLLDCGTAASKIPVGQEEQGRIMDIPKDNGFDTFIALGRFMSAADRGSIVAIGADNGPTNVVARCIDTDAQDYMALVIPNGSEHDMRMNGDGSNYRQMLSNCRVYKCGTPADQESVIAQAYEDMMSQDLKPLFQD